MEITEEQKLKGAIQAYIAQIGGVDVWCMPSEDQNFNLYIGTGLLLESGKDYAQMFSIFKRAGLVERVEGPNSTVVFTDLGKKHLTTNAGFTSRERRVHCMTAGRRLFDRIENHAELDGKPGTRKVVYIYKITDVPDWAMGTEMLATVPILQTVKSHKEKYAELAKRGVTTDPSFTDTIELKRTANGWMEISRFRLAFDN